MPISDMPPTYTSEHWSDVREIIYEAIESADFAPRIVSDANEVGIIQARIIQNLYNDPIVVCDVSGKNANVMFELGLRLAFDKPTIVLKDDITAYSFDTSPIEHLPYPKDLRHRPINEFKSLLAQKIKATHTASLSDPSHSVFLRYFGEFTVKQIEKTEVSSQQFVLKQLKALADSVQRIEARQLNERRLADDGRAQILNPLGSIDSLVVTTVEFRNLSEIEQAGVAQRLKISGLTTGIDEAPGRVIARLRSSSQKTIDRLAHEFRDQPFHLTIRRPDGTYESSTVFPPERMKL